MLLLDEPLGALDAKLRKALQIELKTIQEEVGITFVYVTHDQEEALTLSDRIAVMNEGRVLQMGTPEEIYETPGSRFVADFIGKTNFFEGTIEDVGDTVLVREKGGALMRCARPRSPITRRLVSVSIRPERIFPRANGSMNSITGTLARRTYLGDLVEYHVTRPTGGEVVMQRQNDRGDPAASWGVGDRVELSWDEASAAILDHEGDLFAEDEERRLVDSESPGA